MILLNNPDGLLVSNKPIKNDLLIEIDNKNLWKLALEKNGLHLALNKFEPINAGVKPNVILDAVDPESVNKYVHRETDDAEVVEGHISAKLKNEHTNALTDIRGISSIKNSIRLNTIQPALLGETILNKSFTRFDDMVVMGAYKDLAKNTQWLNKNVIVTAVNSNLEVWIRDASLSGNKLSDFLKNIKQSMAELGASLSKVSINGKVAFDREK